MAARPLRRRDPVEVVRRYVRLHSTDCMRERARQQVRDFAAKHGPNWAETLQQLAPEDVARINQAMRDLYLRREP